MIPQLHMILVAVVGESLHFAAFVLCVLCRIGDAILPSLVARLARFILRCPRLVVRLPNGVDEVVGEVQRSIPFFDAKSSPAVLFEGVPYAILPDGLFGAAQPADLHHAEKKGANRRPTEIINLPRFGSVSFKFGSSAALAPQPVKIFALDSPLLQSGPQALLALVRRGYLGDASSCLQLNVWAPRNAVLGKSESNRELLPVFVFFHGGAFVFGSSHQKLANGQAMSERGCVVVSCNYRLGLFGYLRVPGKPSNRALRDQLDALRWVQRNISAFGGDPTNVTVGGQSAGSMSVGCLLGTAAPHDEKLFHKAIMQSGAAQHISSEAAAQRLFGHAARIADMDDIAFARYLDVAPLRDLVQLQAKIEYESAVAYRQHKTEHILPLMPHVDAAWGPSSILPIHPVLAVEERARSGAPLIPLLIGFTDAEYTFFTRMVKIPVVLPLSDVSLNLRVRQWLFRLFQIPVMPEGGGSGEGEKAFASTAKRIEDAYRDGMMVRRIGPPHAEFVAVNGDFMFRLPSIFLANIYAKAEEKAARCWVYRLDRPAALPGLGATHALDLHYVFNSWWCLPYYTGGWSSDVQRVSNAMGGDFAAFIKADPATDSSPPSLGWSRWNSTTRPMRLYGTGINFDATMTVENADAAETAAWGDLLGHLLHANNA